MFCIYERTETIVVIVCHSIETVEDRKRLFSTPKMIQKDSNNNQKERKKEVKIRIKNERKERNEGMRQRTTFISNKKCFWQ